MVEKQKRIVWSALSRTPGIVISLMLMLTVGAVLSYKALNTDPVISVPTPIIPMPNAYNYFVKAANSVVGGNKIGFAISKWDPTKQASGDERLYNEMEKEALVQENLVAIQTLHTGFAYPFQAHPARSFTASYSEYEKERGLARLLSLQAQTQAAKGNWNGAMQSDLDSVQMGEMMPHGSTLIGKLVGIACEAIGRRPAWETVSHLNSLQAKTAARRLERISSFHVPFAETLQEGEWAEQASLLELMQKPDWSSKLTSLIEMSQEMQKPGWSGSLINPSEAGNGTWRHRLLALRVELTGKRTITRNYARYMDQSIANAKQPYAAHPPAPVRPSDPLSQIMPRYATVDLNDVKAETQNRLLLVPLALCAYQQDHGAYPEKLTALVPAYLSAVPTDPFALSGPLRYKLTGKTYVLYSVGPDGKDDGGKPIFDATQNPPAQNVSLDRRFMVNENSKGDIVAGVNNW